MDILRPNAKPGIFKRRKIWIATAGCVFAGVVIIGMKANSASMRVEAPNISTSLVERGPLVVTVQGSGVLRAKDIRVMAAQTEARVESVMVQPGNQVKVGDLLVQLSNPSLQQQAKESRWSLQQADAELAALRTQLDSEQLNQHASVAKAKFAKESARLQVEAEADLFKSRIVSKLQFERSKLNLKQLEETLNLEQERLIKGKANNLAQLAAKTAIVARLRDALQRVQDQVAALGVRAPMDATVTELNLQPGQAVLPGASLVKLANPDKLYCELQIQESQGRDLAVGQLARVDVRNATIEAQVMRVAPAVSNGTVRVDLSLSGSLPRGARPDLSVDGTIEVAHIKDALQVGRPVFSQPDSPAAVYRVDKNNVAERVNVEFGTAAINRIVVKNGLNTGDRIVVSDTTSWRDHSRVKIQ